MAADHTSGANAATSARSQATEVGEGTGAPAYWQVPPVQVRPEQQSLPPVRQSWPRIWQRQVPIVEPVGRSQSISPQQSMLRRQLSPLRRHWQAPLTQSTVPQHSRLLVHGTGGSVVVSAGGRQHLRLMPEGCAPHSKPEQHVDAPPSPVAMPPSPTMQSSPGGMQPGVRQRPPRHSRPEQQPSLVVHISSSRRHAHVPDADIMPVGRLHRAPPQQSESVMHVASRARQVQRPFMQSCQPQQSSCAVHAPPVLRQQVRVPPGCSPQVASPQQAWPAMQVRPSARHIPPSPPSAPVPPSVPVPPSDPVPPSEPPSRGTSVPASAMRRHTPIVQEEPAQHSLVSWQLRPSAWQAQRPPVQSM